MSDCSEPRTSDPPLCELFNNSPGPSPTVLADSNFLNECLKTGRYRGQRSECVTAERDKSLTSRLSTADSLLTEPQPQLRDLPVDGDKAGVLTAGGANSTVSADPV